jgi:hypothetical protein
MRKRTIQLPDNTAHVTYTDENISDALQVAARARQRGDERAAQNAESFARMVSSVLAGGDYYYSGIDGQ